MALCPSCGTDNPERAKSCLECATPLTVKGSVAAEERKVVSVPSRAVLVDEIDAHLQTATALRT